MFHNLRHSTKNSTSGTVILAKNELECIWEILEQQEKTISHLVDQNNKLSNKIKIMETTTNKNIQGLSNNFEGLLTVIKQIKQVSINNINN